MKTNTVQRTFTAVRSTPGIQRPHAVLYINDAAFAGVCAWCSDKEEADEWCQKQGFVTTHSICPACRARLQHENERICNRYVA